MLAAVKPVGGLVDQRNQAQGRRAARAGEFFGFRGVIRRRRWIEVGSAFGYRI